MTIKQPILQSPDGANPMIKRPCRLALAIASTVAIGCQGEANSPPSPQSLKPNVSQEAATSLATDAAAAQAANLPPLSGASQAPAEQTLIEPSADLCFSFCWFSDVSNIGSSALCG